MIFFKHFLKILFTFGLLFSSLISSESLYASNSVDEAMSLAQAVYDRPAGRDASSQIKMIIKGKNKRTRIRHLSSYKLDLKKGERWTLMRFSLPADIKNTGLLTMDHPGDESDQWIYLPALDRVRLISSKRKGGRFVGSDFTYEDLRDREPEMDRHTLAGREKVGGLVCEKLISIPVDRKNSIYSKRISWIHKKTLLPIRIDFYKKGRKAPYKRMKAKKLKKIQGYWSILDSTMYNLKTGSQTKLATLKIKYDLGLPKKLFSKQSLADPSREKAFEQ